MIICQHCHAQTDDGSVFCDQCGHELTTAPQGAPQRTLLTPPPISSDALRVPLATHYPPAQNGRSAQRSGAQGQPTLAAPIAIILRLATGQQFTLRGKTDYTIGRRSADHTQPDLDLASVHGVEAGVSRQHLKIHIADDGVFVEDLESTNETVHNGFRLMPQQWYPLRDGDELRLGAIILNVSFQR